MKINNFLVPFFIAACVAYFVMQGYQKQDRPTYLHAKIFLMQNGEPAGEWETFQIISYKDRTIRFINTEGRLIMVTGDIVMAEVEQEEAEIDTTNYQPL